MRIKTFAGVFCGGVAAALLGLIGYNVSTSLTQLGDARTLRQSVEVRNDLAAATIAMSLERSITQVGLGLPSPLPGEFRGLLDNQRKTVDTALSAIIEKAEASQQLPNRDAFVRRLQGLSEQMGDLRQRADADLSRARAERSADFTAIPGEIKRVIEDFQATSVVAAAQHLATPPIVAFETRVQDLAWEMREYGGRERTLLAIALATGEPISAQALGEARILDQRAMRAWRTAEILVADPMAPPEVVEAADAVKSGYLRDYAELRRTVFAQSANGQFTVAFGDFFARSSQALGLIETLSASTGEGAMKEARNLESMAARKLALNVGLALALAAGLAFATWYFNARVSRRVEKLAHAMEALSKGDLNVDVSPLAARDEIGDMVNAVGVFRTNAATVARLDDERKAREAQAAAERAATLAALADSFDANVQRVVNAVAASAADIERAAEDLRRSAERASADSDEVARAADQSASNVQTVASASEEMSSSIAEIAQQSSQAAQNVRGVEKQARDTNTTVTQLAEAAARIGQVVNLITDIAGQTNLLALNATIEAARAGEAGRGFAVVAQEVKTLAEQTAKATEEIGQQIEGVQKATQEAVNAIGAISSTIGGVTEITTAISAAVEEQMAAVGEIARSTSDVASASTQVSRAIVRVQEGAGETLSGAERMRSAARALSQESAKLKDEAAGFVARVRAM